MHPSHPLIQSPFDRSVLGTFASRNNSVGITLTPRCLASLMLVGTWVGAGQALAQALAVQVGGAVPNRVGEVTHTAAQTILRVAPEEFWILSDLAPDGGADWRQLIPADVGTVSDLSHARCAVHIHGPQTLALLRKMLALDTRLANFPIGQCRHSAHHHIPWLLHRLGEHEFDVYLLTTYARDALGSLKDSALEYGVSLDCARLA